MTINGITQTYASFSALRLTVNVSAPRATTAPSAGSTGAPTDTVTLSPEATAPVADGGDAGTTPPVNETPVTPVTPTPAPPDRAGALFGALDADQDGAITEDEFKTGAKQILGRGRGPRRADHDDHDHHDRGNHGLRRLDRKLDKLFDRVDANGDGSIDKSELTDALAAVDKRRQPPPPQGAEPGADPAAGQGASDGTVVTFSLTFVSIAVKRYTSLQPQSPAAGGTTTGAPASEPSVDTPTEPAVEAPRAA